MDNSKEPKGFNYWWVFRCPFCNDREESWEGHKLSCRVSDFTSLEPIICKRVDCWGEISITGGIQGGKQLLAYVRWIPKSMIDIIQEYLKSKHHTMLGKLNGIFGKEWVQSVDNPDFVLPKDENFAFVPDGKGGYVVLDMNKMSSKVLKNMLEEQNELKDIAHKKVRKRYQTVQFKRSLAGQYLTWWNKVYRGSTAVGKEPIIHNDHVYCRDPQGRLMVETKVPVSQIPKAIRQLKTIYNRRRSVKGGTSWRALSNG